MLRRRLVGLTVWVGCLLAPTAVVTTLLLDHALGGLGRGDLSELNVGTAVFVLAIFTAVTVGAALITRGGRNPVGWLFLALGDILAVGAAGTSYAGYGALARPGSLRAAAVVGEVSDVSYIWWIVIVGLVLHLTPTGHAVSARWRYAAVTLVASGALWYALALVRPGHLNEPVQELTNPLALRSISGVLAAPTRVASLLTGLGVLAGGASLVARWRRSAGDERRRLWWMALAAVLVPVLVAVTFVLSYVGNTVGLIITAGGFVVVLPVAAGLSVAQYRLYDVDRIVSRAVTYVVMSALLAASYLAVLYAVGRTLGGLASSSRSATVAATLAAVAVAAPSYRHVQESVDRRFNRRRFEALSIIRRFTREPVAGVTVQDALREALNDDTVTVAYWVDSRQTWVTGDGQAAEPAAGSVAIDRYGRPVARVAFDVARTEQNLVEAAAAEATAELDNARLRADLALRLLEVQESRARIATSQVAERQRIERNLHDGAQQRLLALALQLRAAHGNGDQAGLRQTVQHGIGEIQVAIAELRELANGLHPSALSSGGLAGALDDLASRSPIPVTLAVTEARFPAEVETTAWFIACEAITNAVKHASPSTIGVTVESRSGRLHICVRDDGQGGADPTGTGLRGIADRAEALGGLLIVQNHHAGGTCVHAELPCE
jgi:signal transduction histidine kinase